eukprot:TRINITY_DN72817_c0_g1_i1.p1 TRINITY_DN72817_c0_g1~~TRINITY_DN72817_c0_g1_i1.p1  ORF type:complete len:232 (+),score=27.35 TRINITY_DN72817_c0_g1_i1:62-757(+)
MGRLAVLGICGGFCTGKSVTCTVLRRKGAHVVSADLLAHAAYLPGTECYRAVRREFAADLGPFPDGEPIDRRRLGAAVFGSPDALRRLNALVWPAVRRLAEEEIAAHRARCDVQGADGVVALEAAVMLEAGWDGLCDALWVMTVDPAEAIRRLQSRNNLSESEAAARVASQPSNEQRVNAARKLFGGADSAARLRVMDRTRPTLSEAEAAIERMWDGLLTARGLIVTPAAV